MDLLRDWRRRTFGAAIGAVVAPAAIIAAALAVGIGGGGLGSIRSIGQALSGPQLPEIAPAAPEDRTADDAGRLLARVRPARHGRSRGTATARTRRTGATRTPATIIRRPSPTATTGPVRTRTPAPTAQAPAPAATPAPTATPVPARTPSPVRQLGDGVKTITDQVPVAGPPVGQVVDLLVDTIDKLPPAPIIH
jgi:hypothetical protein